MTEFSEFGIVYVISAFCATSIPHNVKITQKISSSEYRILSRSWCKSRVSNGSDTKCFPLSASQRCNIRSRYKRNVEWTQNAAALESRRRKTTLSSRFASASPARLASMGFLVAHFNLELLMHGIGKMSHRWTSKLSCLHSNDSPHITDICWLYIYLSLSLLLLLLQ